MTPAKVVLQPRPGDNEAMLSLASQHGYGLECIDFANPELFLAQDWRQRAKHLRARYRDFAGPVWLHGPYLDLYVNSPDPVIRVASEDRIRHALAIAAELGAIAAVFHTNHLPCTTVPIYTEYWKDRHIAFWQRACQESGVRVLLENMWDHGPDLLRAVTAEVPQLEVCLDVGHANVFSHMPLASWFEELGGRITYIHMSDNRGDADSSLPPGEGLIDWRQFSQLVLQHCDSPAVMLGIADGGMAAIKQTLQYLHAHSIYPFPLWDEARDGD